MNKEILEKRKINSKNMKNDIKNVNLTQKFATNTVFGEQQIKYISWIKTLLWAHRILPNIVSTIDKIVLSYATSFSNGSHIFDDKTNGTFGQVDEIIKLEDRKVSLINLKIMIETMVASLPKKYKDYVELKYYQNKKYPVVALELDIDERTCYRWNKIVLTKLMKFCALNNWSLEFIVSQVKVEKWLIPHYNKNYKLIKKSFEA